MFYCEKCNCAMPQQTCCVCGKKNLREVTDEDFCYFITLSADDAHFLEVNLNGENIPVAKLGVGRINFAFGSSGKFKIYIPYGYFGQAREICTVLGIS